MGKFLIRNISNSNRVFLFSFCLVYCIDIRKAAGRIDLHNVLSLLFPKQRGELSCLLYTSDAADD